MKTTRSNTCSGGLAIEQVRMYTTLGILYIGTWWKQKFTLVRGNHERKRRFADNRENFVKSLLEGKECNNQYMYM